MLTAAQSFVVWRRSKRKQALPINDLTGIFGGFSRPIPGMLLVGQFPQHSHSGVRHCPQSSAGTFTHRARPRCSSPARRLPVRMVEPLRSQSFFANQALSRINTPAASESLKKSGLASQGRCAPRWWTKICWYAPVKCWVLLVVLMDSRGDAPMLLFEPAG